jgi:hypothetical protein
MLNLGTSQGKSVFVLHVKNAFQNTIQFDASKRTHNMLPPFFLEYLRLCWSDHPEVEAITNDPQLYALQNFRFMQGEKDAGRHWYQLLLGALRNVGMHRSVADHAVFTWTEPAA